MNQSIQVYKFGGASLANPERLRNVASIIQSHSDKRLVVVASAIGKTTNALEEVAKLFSIGESESAIKQAYNILEEHKEYCKELLQNPTPVIDQLSNFFVEIEWLLEENLNDDYSYNYDQIVSIGELISTTILNGYLIEQQVNSTWLDARDFIKTSAHYQEADIQWDETTKAISDQIPPVLEKGQIVITQGFIGSTDDNNTTTLGREGSDFTGSILANALNAESLTIWKDVPGVLNADPKWQSDTVLLKNISYSEAVEMTFYGAKVIHPKTIKPLQNKKIPLYVRSFVHPNEPGTCISTQNDDNWEKPVYVLKENQVLLYCKTKDFDFFDTDHIAEVLRIFDQEHCDINLLQNGAVQCSFVFDNDQELIKKLVDQLAASYDIELMSNLDLITMRHYTIKAIEDMMGGKSIVLVQRTPETCQIVFKA